MPSTERTRPRSRYVASLDGLRCFAVVAVILYHMGLISGGLVGVTTFFVISGYLINGLLLAEFEREGAISLKAFWLRRARRLLPAILLAVAGTAALCTLFDHVLLDKMRPDIVPSLLFYNNWWQIFHDISYFEAAGSPSPLTHFWSLSIEEQFYVVWPLILLGMLKAGTGKQGIARVALVLAVVSALAMALLYDPQGDPSRVYYGTDTRAMSLLVGIWLSIAWPCVLFGKARRTSQASTMMAFNIVGVAAFAGLVAIAVLTNGYDGFSYYGGITLASVLSAVVIAVLVVPGTWLERLFKAAPLVWIGKISYGMYLWHFPILLLTTDPNSTTATPWWVHVGQFALVVAVSALSYYFVEDPIRTGKVRAWWDEWRAPKRAGAPAAKAHGSAPRARALQARYAIPAACFAGLLAIGAIGVVAVPPTDYASTYAGATAASGQVEGESSSAAPEAATSSQPVDASSDAGRTPFEQAFLSPRESDSGGIVYEPLLIGDSVAAGAVDAFYETFPNGHIDAVESRNIWESPYQDYADADQVGDYVVFCLGTNNAVVDWQIDDELLGMVPDDKKVFMVNTRNTADWMEGTNAEIARAPERHANVVVIDWYSASQDHDEYFAGDGTHLTDEGAHAYISLIRQAIEATL